MMDGRVKTLHPNIHGALLAFRDNREHVAAMQEHGIEPIDMVVVNLYPFEETIAGKDVSLAEAIEKIDIGGPAMIRSAAKNWRDVAVVVHAWRYESVLNEMRNPMALFARNPAALAQEAFKQTAIYDMTIRSYLAAQETPAICGKRRHQCRCR